jgi:hypothetical protein
MTSGMSKEVLVFVILSGLIPSIDPHVHLLLIDRQYRLSRDISPNMGYKRNPAPERLPAYKERNDTILLVPAILQEI